MTPFKPLSRFIFFSFTLLFLVGRTDSLAQATRQKIRFSSINEIGLLTGEKGEALAIQTTNGIQKGKSFAGIGVGFDYYGHRTIPLFASYRSVLTNNKNPLFAYANAGLNFLWLSTTQKNELQASDPSSGYFYDFGMGWKLAGKKGTALMLSAGYTAKQAKYSVPTYSIFSFPQIDSEGVERFSFLYRRVIVKIGLQL